MALDYQVSQKIVTPQLAALTDNTSRSNLLPETNALAVINFAVIKAVAA